MLKSDSVSSVRYLNEVSLKRYKKLVEISKDTGMTVGEAAIAALSSSCDFDTIPIVGCKNIRQLKESMSGASRRLTREQIEFIYE